MIENLIFFVGGFVGGCFVTFLIMKSLNGGIEEEVKDSNSSAYFDMDEWKRCIDECPYYTYESKPKKKKRKK